MNSTRLATFAQWARAFDTETWVTEPGLAAPPLVCASIAWWDGHRARGIIVDKEGAYQHLLSLLGDPRIILVGLHIAYDFLVMAVYAQRVHGVDLMPLIFGAYLQDRVFDIGIAQALDAVARGHLGKDPNGRSMIGADGKVTERYSLYTVTRQLTGRTDAKVNDKWRLRYRELDGVPLPLWPPEASQYPVDDVVNTLTDAMIQVKGHRNLHEVAFQSYKAWCLHLGAAWGVRTDRHATAILKAAAMEARVAGMPDFITYGFIRPDGSEDQAVVKRAVAIAYGCTGTCGHCCGTGKVYNKFSKVDGRAIGKPINCVECSATGLDLRTGVVPMTDPSTKFPKGQVKAGRDELMESGDERLMAYGLYQEDDKILDTYIPFLEEGHDVPIVLRPNAILETGRVSYDGKIQVLPRMLPARLLAALKKRGAAVLGVRDCVVPRPPLYETVEVPDGYVLQPGESYAHPPSCP